VYSGFCRRGFDVGLVLIFVVLGLPLGGLFFFVCRFVFWDISKWYGLVVKVRRGSVGCWVGCVGGVVGGFSGSAFVGIGGQGKTGGQSKKPRKKEEERENYAGRKKHPHGDAGSKRAR